MVLVFLATHAIAFIVLFVAVTVSIDLALQEWRCPVVQWFHVLVFAGFAVLALIGIGTMVGDILGRVLA